MPQITVLSPARQTAPSLAVAAGDNLMQALDDAGVIIQHACGGNSICGTCAVRVLAGGDQLPSPTYGEAVTLKKLPHGPGVRLACQVAVLHDLSVQVVNG